MRVVDFSIINHVCLTCCPRAATKLAKWLLLSTTKKLSRLQSLDNQELSISEFTNQPFPLDVKDFSSRRGFIKPTRSLVDLNELKAFPIGIFAYLGPKKEVLGLVQDQKASFKFFN